MDVMEEIFQIRRWIEILANIEFNVSLDTLELHPTISLISSRPINWLILTKLNITTTDNQQHKNPNYNTTKLL